MVFKNVKQMFDYFFGRDEKTVALNLAGGLPPATTKAAPTAAKPSPTTLKAERQKLDAERRKFEAERLAHFENQAEDFIWQQMEAGRLTPAETAAVKEMFVRFALDDHLDPLPNAQTRLDCLKATIEKRPPHIYFREFVDPQATARVLMSM